tara:strand:- start:3395 stop:5119 length:1725 start_codon:yes stop_codon:yes gene_type:complete
MARTKVQSELIATNAISGTIIADGAITSTHLAANCVDSSELVTGSIDTIHIAANQVTATKIVTNGVLTRHISDDQITADKLANSINTDIATGVTANTTANAALPKAGGTMTGNVTAPKFIMTGGSQIGQDYAYLKSNSTSNASLTLRKDSTGADSIDFLQLRSDGNGLIGKIEGDGDISFKNATFTGTIDSGAHTLTTGDLTINDDEGKIRFASTLNWDIQPETDDASLRIKTSSGANREVIFENTGSGVLGLDVEGGLKLGTSLEIASSNAAEISITGSGAGNLVAANDLYIMAGSGTSAGNLYLGSDGTNAQVYLNGGQLTTEGITAVSTGNYSTGNVGLIAKSVSNRGTVRVRSDGDNPAELFFDVNGGIRWDFSSRSSSSNYDLLMYPQHGTPALNAVAAHVFRFTQTGHFGIGTNTSARSGLDVDGAVTSSNSDNDLLTHSYSSYASRVSSGRIDVTSGYSGTLASGRKFIFKYNATSWKAYHGRITLSGTGGFASYEFGGYWNNSGSAQTEEMHDALQSSCAVTTSGQAIIVTITIGQTVVHPCLSVEYNQSGGDGAPRMDRAEFFIQ